MLRPLKNKELQGLFNFINFKIRGLMTKTIGLSSVLWFFVVAVTAQNVGINTTGATPAQSAILDISATNQGLLVPRMSISDATLAAPVTSPATSLLVYNTNAAITNGSGTGYYYWNGSQWTKLMDTAGGSSWDLLGNSGTSAATNFIGTTDATDWVVKTNNTEVMRVKAGGKVGIGTTAPTYKLDVTTSALAIRGTTTSMFTTSVYGHSENVTAGNGVAGQSDGASALMAGVYATAQNGAMALITNGPSNLNINGGDYDTWIEGDTDAELVYIDAGNDRVGISTNAPSNILDIEVNSTATQTGSDGLELNQSGTGDIAIDWKIGGVSKSTWYLDNSQAGDPFVVYNPAYGVIYRRDVSGRVGIGYHFSGMGVDEPNTSLSASSSHNAAGQWILKCVSTTLSTPRFGVRSDGGVVLYNRSNTITSSETDGVILFAEDVSGSSMLKVRNEAGFVTVLSPHNFSLIPAGPSEELSWSFYSEHAPTETAINVDLLKVVREVEQLTGKNLVFTANTEDKNADGTYSKINMPKAINNSLAKQVDELKSEIETLHRKNKELRMMVQQLAKKQGAQ